MSSTCCHRRAQVKSYAFVDTAIIGWYSRLGQWSRVENHAIVGEDVSTKDGVHLNGAVVLPHKELKESVPEPKIIM
jgi:mannose-1-phosphate guanylyltransferase